MIVEYLLYAYALVCVSMIAFDIAFDLVMRYRSPRRARRVAELRGQMLVVAAQLGPKEVLPEAHARAIGRMLRRIGGVMVVDEALAQASEEAPFRDSGYRPALAPLLDAAAGRYEQAEPMEAAFYALFLARHRAGVAQPGDAVMSFLFALLAKPSLYSRVNAFKAVCALGTAECVKRALRIVDRKNVNRRVVTEALLAFQGSRAALAEELWAVLPEYGAGVQDAVVSFIRFSNPGFQRRMLELAQDASFDKEVRLSALRYLGRHPFSAAHPALLAFARRGGELDWEYAVVALSALASYPGAETLSALKEAVRSPRWHLRENAAASLAALGVAEAELADVLQGTDRFAAEILAYHLERRRAREGESA